MLHVFAPIQNLKDQKMYQRVEGQHQAASMGMVHFILFLFPSLVFPYLYMLFFLFAQLFFCVY